MADNRGRKEELTVSFAARSLFLFQGGKSLLSGDFGNVLFEAFYRREELEYHEEYEEESGEDDGVHIALQPDEVGDEVGEIGE